MFGMQLFFLLLWLVARTRLHTIEIMPGWMAVTAELFIIMCACASAYAAGKEVKDDTD